MSKGYKEAFSFSRLYKEIKTKSNHISRLIDIIFLITSALSLEHIGIHIYYKTLSHLPIPIIDAFNFLSHNDVDILLKFYAASFPTFFQALKGALIPPLQPDNMTQSEVNPVKNTPLVRLIEDPSPSSISESLRLIKALFQFNPNK